MKRIEDRQLARLGSVKDLQAAKRRVNRAIREMEESVKDDYEAALEAFFVARCHLLWIQCAGQRAECRALYGERTLYGQ